MSGTEAIDGSLAFATWFFLQKLKEHVIEIEEEESKLISKELSVFRLSPYIFNLKPARWTIAVCEQMQTNKNNTFQFSGKQFGQKY